jgi:hypothetical protein
MVLREEGVRMTSKITWRDEEKFTKALLRKMQSCTGEIRIFPRYTEIDGRRFIDLNDFEEE